MKLRVAFLGDIVGSTGRAMFQKHIARIRSDYMIDAVIVNGENSARQGRGITPGIMKFFKHCGVDVVTSGNHIWQCKDIYSYLAEHKDLLRPANFPSDNPGTGVTTFMCKGYEIAVINLQGRVFMREQSNCPFRAAESLLTYVRSKTKLIFVDFHAETTSEKMGIAYFLDGKISGLVGTHTHIQTADERVLPNGTAYITDLGMAGSLNSMLGMKKEPIIQNFITQMPTKFEVDTAAPGVISGVWIEVDTDTGLATDIQRIRIIDQDLHVDTDEI
jgi:metallophosphoesterase (TIGR00282 family)